MNLRKTLLAASLMAAIVPGLSYAGPESGENEFTLSGTGVSDKDFDNSSFGLSGDSGWLPSDRSVWGIRQSINYADVDGGGLGDDFWNGSTRGYYDYHFGSGAARPFVGASLGAVYGDGVKDTGIAGLELGLKYYVLESTFILARAEYQFFFDSSDSAEDNFDDGAWQYVFGIGFNF